jgi:hypothetical protein
MGKRPRGYQNKDDMEIQALKDHLSKQDKMLTEQKEEQGRQMTLIKEVLFILGGSSSMDVKGLRQDFRDVRQEVSDVRKEVQKVSDKVQTMESVKGKWIIAVSSIPQKIVAFFVFVGMMLSIALAIKDLFLNK